MVANTMNVVITWWWSPDDVSQLNCGNGVQMEIWYRCLPELQRHQVQYWPQLLKGGSPQLVNDHGAITLQRKELRWEFGWKACLQM